MATNLDIDGPAVEELISLGGFRSKREAVDAAVREAIAYRRQMHVIDVLGTIDFTSPGPGREATPSESEDAESGLPAPGP